MKCIHTARDRQKGSLLIVAMIFCAIIGVSLASYLQLGRTSLEISNRALYNNAAMNLAENGLEEAMYSLNRRIADPSYSWSDWTNSGGTGAWRTLPGSGTYTFDQNATGIVRVYVDDYLGGSPTAIARSTVTLGGSNRTIEKWVEVQLRKTSKFANGLVAREYIRFTGTNASVDSWNSDPDKNPATAAIPYGSGTRKANGSIGSASVAVGSPLLHNVSIWGHVATGGALPVVGSRGLVGPFGTPEGTINTGWVSTDFTANFGPVTALGVAGYSLGSVTTDLTLPRPGDTPAADGRYYYIAASLSFDDKTLNIQKRTASEPAPKIVLTLTSALESISITGTSGALNIEKDARLDLYAPGDILIAARGVMSGSTAIADVNQPIRLQIWGTKTSGGQRIELAGNGVLSAVVYAPQGSVRINGDTDVCGSVVANDITVTGNAAFHFDESLADFGGTNPFRVARWKELTTADSRSTRAAVLDF
jgi:hypothetical protein